MLVLNSDNRYHPDMPSWLQCKRDLSVEDMFRDFEMVCPPQVHQPSQPNSARSVVSARSLGGFSVVSGQTAVSSLASGANHAAAGQPAQLLRSYPPVAEEAGSTAESVAADGRVGPLQAPGADGIAFANGQQAGGSWFGADAGNGDDSSAFFETIGGGACSPLCIVCVAGALAHITPL